MLFFIFIVEKKKKNKYTDINQEELTYKKIFSFVFACLLAFILIVCNADEKDNKLDDNNDNEVINQGSDNLGEEKLGNNENNVSNETNNENNENQDPIEVVKEDKFVMVEDDTIFSFEEQVGGGSCVLQRNSFSVIYDDDDVAQEREIKQQLTRVKVFKRRRSN